MQPEQIEYITDLLADVEILLENIRMNVYSTEDDIDADAIARLLSEMQNLTIYLSSLIYQVEANVFDA